MKKSRTASRTINILELIANTAKGISLSEIAFELDIPVTSVKDIIEALLDSEMIEMIDERSKLYGIGVKTYYIGNTYITNSSMIDKAKDIVEKLGTSLNKTVFIGKEVNGKITYLYKYEPQGFPINTCDIGARVNLHSTSLGKTYLAFSPGLLEKLQGRELHQKTPYTITNYDELVKEIEKVRRQGYASDIREQTLHQACIGAPVFNHKNEIVAAISVTGLYSPDIEIEKELAIIKESALNISRKMGYTGN